MNNLEKLLNGNSFSLNEKEKYLLFKKDLNQLTFYHYKNSSHYKKILDFLGFKPNKTHEIDKLPFIPVRIFKEFDLMSIKKDKIIKTLNSSGTSSNKRSKIYLDKQNAYNQVKVLQNITNNILGKDRLPMLIIDKKIHTTNRNNFNARIAAINGFSIFGKNHTYLINEKDEIDYDILNNFLEKYSTEIFFVFGFTSLVYENLIKKLSKKLIFNNFNKAILIHGGGWKKLENIKVSNKIFKTRLNDKFNLHKIYNYYGLVEQTGSIFFECKCGYFVASDFSEVLVRDSNFNRVKNNKKGFLQLLSLLPTSYPGHNIITEDIGEIIDKKKCKCKLSGTRFLVHGRYPKAELRGCSDT